VDEKMKPAITDSHDRDQKDLDDSAALHGACDTDLAKHQAALDTTYGDFKKKHSEHLSCRKDDETPKAEEAMVTCPAEEAAAKKAMEEKCAEKDAAQTDTVEFGACEASCNYKTQDAEACWDAAYANVKDLKDYYGKKEETYKRLVGECDKLTTAYNLKAAECAKAREAQIKQSGECDIKQLDAESAYCGWRDRHEEMCNSYAGCQSSRETEFNNIKDQVGNREADRVNEWTATSKIGCMLTAWEESGAVTEATITACDAKKVDTTHLNIKVPELGAAQECKAQPMPAFETEYAEFANKEIEVAAEPLNECLTAKDEKSL